jgi:ABC-type branched-subunit amino acid transport system ATPase component
MTEPIQVALRGLTKQFGGVTAVDRIDLEHSTGGVFGLIGPNGAGKTTLFNMLSGALQPTSGTIELDGRDVTGLRPDLMNRAGVARTFQNLQVFGSLSVLDNVMIARERHVRGGVWRALLGVSALGRTESTERDLAVGILERVGLSRFTDADAGSLPYGLQRRVEVARALASQPRLLLLDEPLAGLSRAESVDLGELFRSVAAEGVTVLLVEHDVSTVMAVSDRVVVLDHGTLLADGPAAKVQADPRVRAAYLGEEMPT